VTGFAEVYGQEFEKTKRVVDAFPADKKAFKPHDRSNPAHMLLWTFVLEEQLMLKAARGEQVMTGGGFPKPPDSWQEMLDRLDAGHKELMAQLAKGIPKGKVKWMTGPKQTGDYEISDFLWFLLHDQIHHRGQLTVYVRMAGGKVPAVYGPSADEPWL
jgi:uncharacterized damage-inducible protein DinB